MDQVEFNDLNVFLKGPLLLADVWVKVVVPTFPTLLANSAWQTFGYLGPVTWPMLENELDENLVFGQGPGTRDAVTNVVEFKPTGMALDL